MATPATTFQALVWEHFDVETDVTDSTVSANHSRWEGKRKAQNHRVDDEYSEIVHGHLQHIWIFGKTLQGDSVAAKVPCVSYLYVDAPQWAVNKNQMIGEALYKCVHNTYPGSLLSCEYVKRKKFYGYHGDMEFGFYKVSFVSSEALRMCANILRKRPITLGGLSHQFTVYESNVDPTIRFMHDNGFEATGWIALSEKEMPRTVGKETTCKWEFHCRGVESLSSLASNQKAPFVQVSFDIECASSDDSFPDPEKDGCEVIQIGSTVQVLGAAEPALKHIITLGKCNPIPGVCVESYETEREVIEAFARLLRRVDADIILGWNTFQFDMDYIYKRACRCKIRPLVLGRLVKEGSTSHEMTLQSAAHGSNNYSLVTTPGVLHLDIMEAVKREKKLPGYSLKEVSKTFLDEGVDNEKMDLPPKEIFRLFREGESSGITKIAEYCVQDTALPLRISNVLRIVGNMIEMARCSCVPMDFLLKRGMQIKVFSLILKYTMALGYVVPVIARPDSLKRAAPGDPASDKYEGATVLDAKAGVYMGAVATLDFASLYPSIIRAHNMSYDTLVMNPTYLNLPGVEYAKFEWNEPSGLKTVHFVQSREGVLPRICTDLAVWRKEAKREMAAAEKAGDKALQEVMNGRQLAYKVTMNSVYGLCGATRGILPCVEIAAAVTSTGRNMIDHSKRMVEEMYQGSEVVYGDSVTGPTPTTVRVAGRVSVETFERLADRWGGGKWLPCLEGGREDKESCELPGVDVWTEAGWTPALRVIRHRLAPEKRILRVLTHTGMVDATDDHSLLDSQGQAVSAQNVDVGFELLHAPYPTLAEAGEGVSPAEARIMGMFCGDGSCGEYLCLSGKKASWAINNKDVPRIEYYRDLCERVYPEYEWVIMDTIGSSNVYKLAPRGAYGSVVHFVRKFRAALYKGAAKVVPDAILNASIEARQAFWDGLYDADGDKGVNDVSEAMGCVRIDQKNQVSIASFALLASSLGYSTSFNTRADKPNVFRLTLTRKGQMQGCTKLRCSSAVKRVVEVEYDGFVYDLTTKNHHFAAGAGQLVVHNTDSIFVCFQPDMRDVKEAFGLGAEAAALVTKTFKSPIELEFEKVYCPLLLIGKKRYTGLKYEKTPEKPKEIDTKGLQLVRRDSVPLVKDVCTSVVDSILIKRDVMGARVEARRVVSDLLQGKIPIEKLTLSKALRTGYKNLDLPHLAVARKMEQRDPGSGPKPGDRVRYVLVDTGNPADKQSAKAEDPAYAVEKGLPLDFSYYLDHQLKTPLLTLLGLFVTNGDPGERLFGDLIRRYKNSQKKQSMIESFFTKKPSAAPSRWKEMS